MVTIHALNRMEERFPALVAGLTDEQVGRLIWDEYVEAMNAGRYGSVPPLELAPYGVERWHQRPGRFVCWTSDKTRGYAIAERDGIAYVLTPLNGVTRKEALGKLRTRL